VSENSKLVEQLKDKAYREAFVFSQMSIPISFQIRALREQRKLTQKQLAEKANMLQPRIVELERPKGNEPNLRTLGRLAAAFDVALIVRFVPFSELAEWAQQFSPDTFMVPSFEDDPGFKHREAASTERLTPIPTGAHPTEGDHFHARLEVVEGIKPTLRQDAIPFIAPKTAERKIAGELTYDGTEKKTA
jgi:transcriptional regulator with XRE-family HTH domain